MNWKQRLKWFYYETKCWFTFRHHMESLGKCGEGQWMYQCSFCFKRIVVRVIGTKKGEFIAKSAFEKAS